MLAVVTLIGVIAVGLYLRSFYRRHVQLIRHADGWSLEFRFGEEIESSASTTLPE
jgi:hypothetical protein